MNGYLSFRFVLWMMGVFCIGAIIELIAIACCASDEDEHRCGRDGLDGMDGREGSGTDAFFTEDRD